MHPAVVYLILLAASPILMFFVHMITGRLYVKYCLKSSPLVSAIWAVSFSFVIIAILSWKFYLHLLDESEDQLFAVFYGMLVFILIAGAYYILFAMTEAARRIKILQILNHRGEVSEDDLKRDYGSDQLLSVRLERLTAMNQLTIHHDRYHLKSRGLYVVAVIVALWARLLKR